MKAVGTLITFSLRLQQQVPEFSKLSNRCLTSQWGLLTVKHRDNVCLVPAIYSWPVPPCVYNVYTHAAYTVTVCTVNTVNTVIDLGRCTKSSRLSSQSTYLLPHSTSYRRHLKIFFSFNYFMPNPVLEKRTHFVRWAQWIALKSAVLSG